LRTNGLLEATSFFLTQSSQKKKRAGGFEKQRLATVTMQNRQSACKFDRIFLKTKTGFFKGAGWKGFTANNFTNDLPSFFLKPANDSHKLRGLTHFFAHHISTKIAPLTRGAPRAPSA
jgi:hypothetical protein